MSMQVSVVKPSYLLVAYAAIVVGFCLTFVSGMFALTVEPDEVWNLMSTMKAFGLPLPETAALNSPVTTTGGLHFVLHGLIARWYAGDIVIHRLVSIGTTLLLLWLVFITVERQVKDPVLAAAGTALFASAPGFLLQASLATSEIIATTVFLLATLFWARFGTRSVGMAFFGGVLFGVACATRMTCLSMLPAVLVWSMLARRGWITGFVYPMLAVVTAVLVFVAFAAVYFAAFGDTPWSEFLVASGSASGINRPSLGLLMRANYLVVGDGIVPLLAILALAGWYLTRLDDGIEERKVIEICGFLLLAGLTAWLAWVIKAPISHIRYLWPAIPFLWLCAILLGFSAIGRIKNSRATLIVHSVVILACIAQGLINVRMIAVGDSLALVYESARGTRLANPKGYFELRNDQRSMAELLSSLPPPANVYAFSEPAAYPMTYMSGRVVKAFPQVGRASSGDYLLVQPSDLVIWRTKWEFVGWLQNNATVEQQYGGYALYRVHDQAPWSGR